MISRARQLREHASFEDLGWFLTKSVLLAGTLALIGLSALDAVPAFVVSEPSFDKAYIADAIYLLGLLPFMVAILLLAATNYRLLQDTMARCELASDEMALINKHPSYERMTCDRELMKLAANVRRVCLTYPATHGLFKQFLGDYRTLLDDYGGGVDAEIQQARIELLNIQAEEGLERHAARVRREGMRKEREGG